MPELPEVETVKKKLKNKILNRYIKDVNIYWKNIIDNKDINYFVSNIKGQQIIDIKRRGKWLLIELNNYYLVVHLRMEGKFSLKKFNEEKNKHEHVIFVLDNNLELRYNDTRKFGKMSLIDKNEINEYINNIGLGLEPFDNNLTSDYLKDKLKNKTIAIKSALLDQHIIAGIGNIYANEILFLSKIDPLKSSNKLSLEELNIIIKNVKEVLKKAIKKEGTTIKSYVSIDNEEGNFQDKLYVYNRNGLPCKVCGNLIIREKVNGRSTYICPNCQL